MIRLRCQCGKTLKLPKEHAGKAAACPQCKQRIRVVVADAGSAGARFDSLLVIASGPQRMGEQLFLGGTRPIRVGKSADAELQLKAPAVSRMHCRLVPRDNGWRVEDQNSTNGLFVNGRRVKGHNLLSGDRVQIGDFELQYHTDQLAAAAAGLTATATPTDGDESQRELHLLEDAAGMQQTVAVPPPLPVGAGRPAAKQGKKPAKRSAPVPVPAADDDDEPIRFADDEFNPTDLPKPRASGQTCPRCSTTLPPEARICINCGTDLRTGRAIGVRRDTDAEEGGGLFDGLRDFLNDSIRGAAFFVEPGSLITYLIISVIALLQIPLSYALFFGFLGKFIIQGWICAYLFSVVLHCANGEKDLPDISLTGGWVDDIIAPFFKFVGTWAIVLLPAALFGLSLVPSLGGMFSGTSAISDKMIAALCGLVALGIFLWPFAVLIVALGGFGCFFRPDLILYTIIRTFIPYLITFILTAMAFSSTVVVEFFLRRLAPTFAGMLASEAVGIVVSLYVWIVAMRFIGLYYYHFKPRFAWSWG